MEQSRPGTAAARAAARAAIDPPSDPSLKAAEVAWRLEMQRLIAARELAIYLLENHIKDRESWIYNFLGYLNDN